MFIMDNLPWAMGQPNEEYLIIIYDTWSMVD